MTTTLLHLFNFFYLVLSVVVAILTRATPRGVAGAPAGGAASSVVALDQNRDGDEWHGNSRKPQRQIDIDKNRPPCDKHGCVDVSMTRRGKEADGDTAYLSSGRRTGQCAEKCRDSPLPRDTKRRT